MVSKISFRAMVVEETSHKGFIRRIKEISDLPKAEVLIKVHYSSLNYKDALSATGNKGITRRYPHTPAIDAARIIEASVSPYFNPEDAAVVVTGYDLGMNTSGGFVQYLSASRLDRPSLPSSDAERKHDL